MDGVVSRAITVNDSDKTPGSVAADANVTIRPENAQLGKSDKALSFPAFGE